MSRTFCGLGLVMTLATLALILAGNTEFAYRFEHSRFPLSWGFAAVAILAFLAAEVCQLRNSPAHQPEQEDAELVPEWEAVEI
jgi:hypothetical protein